ncbi:MAG: NDMA-dependent alcohol dehydrogenase [Nitrospira sp.]|nr:NDMA-dependent alcohol dehydrogenase [Nitrospira sp.]
MKAAVLETIDSPLVVAEVGLTELSFGQVLVKVLVSGICGAQLQEIAGNKGNAKFVPHLLGHEGCGIVEAIGPGVTRVAVGDKVVMHWRKGDGIESDFPTYAYKGKTIRSGKVTTFSEQSIVSENRLTTVPQDTPEELGALLGCSLSTALSTISIEANVKMGESVMIIGAGGLGANLIRTAGLVSAFPIISVDVHDHKRELAESLGATLYINCLTVPVETELREKLGLDRVDVIIDTSGHPGSIADTIPLLSGTGRYIFLGQPKPGADVTIKNAHHLFEGDGKTLKATQGGGFNPSVHLARYVRLFKAGILKTDGLVTHRMPLDQINEAIGLVREGQAGRIIIDMR